MDVDQETTRSDEAFVDQLARDLYTGSRKLAGLSTLELMEGCGIDPGSGYHIVAQCGWVFIDDAALSEAHQVSRWPRVGETAAEDQGWI